MFRRFLIWIGLAPTDEERKIIKALKQPWNKSCSAAGRGTLTKDAGDVGNTANAIEFRRKCVQILKDAKNKRNNNTA